MIKLTPEKLDELYKKLPQDLKDAYFNAELGKIIQSIGNKYKLMVDKMGELADETALVMIGLVHPKNFIGNLAQRLGVDRQTAKNIAEDINKQVFQGVRKSLKKIHGINGEKDSAPTPIPKEVGVQTPAPQQAASEAGVQKKEIMEEIEKEEEIPEIFKGVKTPDNKEAKKDLPANPFEAKMKGEVRVPMEEKKYPEGDPYREEV